MAAVASGVGQRVPRTDSADKVTGRALYSADVFRPGMLHGAVLRSPHAHARIISVDASRAVALPGVHAVVTRDSLAADVALIVEEEAHAARRVLDLLAAEKVRYEGEKIALVAAETRELAEQAVALIEVVYEPLPALIDVAAAMLPGAPLIHDEQTVATLDDGQVLHNIAGQMHRTNGDLAAGWAAADRVFEDTYTIPRAHQTYLEPQVAVAEVDPQGRVTVWTSTQGHFAIQSNISKSLRLPLGDINVIGMTIGGGFGGKFGGVVDTYAVLLAQASGRPVKLVYSRHDEFLDGRPAPGLRITIKTGVTHDGRITARECWAYWDVGVGSGASWATGRIKGVYDIPAIALHAFEVHTNKPAPGAYRAPGAPQVTFASEAQLDSIAAALGIDPVELRLRNLPDDKPQVAFRRTLLAAAEQVDWAHRTAGPDEGWGVAIGEWTNGAGPAAAVVSLAPDGGAQLFYGLMDLTGTDTACAQIVAEVLDLPYERVRVTRGDTDSAPYGTGSGGSVALFSFGNAVRDAAQAAREQLLELAAAHFSDQAQAVTVADLETVDQQVRLRANPDKAASFAELATLALRQGGPVVGEGRFSPKPSAPTISAQIAKVHVDRGTGQVTLLEFAHALDVGRAISPVSCEGQMEGGAVQGLGWGLMEEMLYDPQTGRNLNPDLLDYRVPTSLDVPPQQTVLVEEPTTHGPFGAKGIGEPPIAPGIAALSNAIAAAVGVRLEHPPFTPERVWRALQGLDPGPART
ncbi:MAG: molybdopterin-dependent oxidoreductase [Fimbriimonadaceae bacterium]|nr:molybdopterin-dependent oxidoreductase [Fimbriimonadaceae bacterium]